MHGPLGPCVLVVHWMAWRVASCVTKLGSYCRVPRLHTGPAFLAMPTTKGPVTISPDMVRQLSRSPPPSRTPNANHPPHPRGRAPAGCRHSAGRVGYQVRGGCGGWVGSLGGGAAPPPSAPPHTVVCRPRLPLPDCRAVFWQERTQHPTGVCAHGCYCIEVRNDSRLGQVGCPVPIDGVEGRRPHWPVGKGGEHEQAAPPCAPLHSSLRHRPVPAHQSLVLVFVCASLAASMYWRGPLAGTLQARVVRGPVVAAMANRSPTPLACTHAFAHAHVCALPCTTHHLWLFQPVNALQRAVQPWVTPPSHPPTPPASAAVLIT
jgi:hypothetical protein